MHKSNGGSDWERKGNFGDLDGTREAESRLPPKPSRGQFIFPLIAPEIKGEEEGEEEVLEVEEEKMLDRIQL